MPSIRSRHPIKKILYSLIAVFLFFLCAEGAFRALGLPRERSLPSPIEFQKIPDTILRYVTEEHRIRLTFHQDKRDTLRSPKPKGAFRVFCFGGSATRGLGFPYNGSFSRWLERILRLSYPDRDMEVVNMGAIGYSTEQVKVLVREVLEKGEPDLLILYSGNNEFLDVKARIAMAELDGRRATRVRGYLETHSVTARLIRSLLPATKNMIRKDEEILSGYLQIKPGPEQIRETDLRYERNLREMIGAARAKNVPFVLCTLIANPQFESFDRSLFGGELEGNPDSRNIYQAAGWARLGRWDKAREALAPLAFLGERRNLLRIFEAGGVRGIDKLSAEAKTDLQKTARAVIEDATAHPDRDESDLYALAISYRLLDDGENLAKVLAKVDQQLRSDRDADHRLGREVLFSQFAGEETYHSAFKSLWAGERATVWATPATNEIVRRVAAGEGAPLADLEKELSDWLDPTPSRYLLDYCHFNIEGAFETAYLLFKTALSARILPPNPERIDPRAVLLAPDLEWLRTKAYDFLERDKYMGLDFRVCFVYCQPHPREAALDEWFEEDSKKEPDADVVSAFKKNRFYYKKI